MSSRSSWRNYSLWIFGSGCPFRGGAVRARFILVVWIGSLLRDGGYFNPAERV